MTTFVNGQTAPTIALRSLVKLAHCCYGASAYGPDRCTCWQPEYDHAEQTTPDTQLEPGTALAMCADCAYRPDSPERTGDTRYQLAIDETTPLGPLTIVGGDTPFWCHQGMRKPVRFRHPAGIVIECDSDDYDPPIIDGVPYRADGTPADRCAGWTAHHEAMLRARAQHQRDTDDANTVALMLVELDPPEPFDQTDVDDDGEVDHFATCECSACRQDRAMPQLPSVTREWAERREQQLIEQMRTRGE